MKRTILAVALIAVAFGIAPLAVHADVSRSDNIPYPQDTPYPGILKIHVDATDLVHHIFDVHEIIPVKSGPMYLLFPKWIPAAHGPVGAIDKLAGLVIHANGKVIPWKRDKFNVYAFHIDVPEGASHIDVDFKFLLAQGRRGPARMTPEMMGLAWSKVSLYPAGHYASQIHVVPSVTFPEGWKFGTALEVAKRDGNTVTFKPIDYLNLIDSPIYAGKYFKRLDLSSKESPPVHMDIVADAPKGLDVSREQLKAMRNLVVQMYKLYGAFHFNHYDFLLSVSDKMSPSGSEHSRSSEDGKGADYFAEWSKDKPQGPYLLAHEFNHSWDGKYRRGAGQAAPNFNVPLDNRLLWVYEGQTEFWGSVIATRAGMVSKKVALEELAYVAASYDMNRPGQQIWRNIQDTTYHAIVDRHAQPYRSYQLNEDYYFGGQMIWLAVDAKMRALSHDQHSMDDFARAFFGMDNGAWDINTYTFDDVVHTLNAIVPYDWRSFLRERLDGHRKITDGIAGEGWKLVYTDKPSDGISHLMSGRFHGVNLTYSAGFSAAPDGRLLTVRWGGPAFKAGLAPGMTIVAVNGKRFNADHAKTAVKAAKGAGKAITLLVKDSDRYKSLHVDYHGGLKYPHLVRIKGKPDYLSELYAPK